MPDAIWYYAQNDVQKDPVSTPTLWAMAKSGQLQPTDLVWKEGMDDWVAAGEVRGLFIRDTDADGASLKQAIVVEASKSDQAAAKRAAAGVEKALAKTPDQPIEKSSERPATPLEPPAVDAVRAAPVANAAVAKSAAAPVRRSDAGGRWASETPNPGAAPPDQAPAPTFVLPQNASPHSAAPAATPAFPRPAHRDRVQHLSSGKDVVRHLGAAASLVGLLFAIGARGCDSVAARYASQKEALAQHAEKEFQHQWDEARSEIDADQSALREKGSLTGDEQARLQFLIDERTRLDEKWTRDRDRLRKGDWRELKYAADQAAASARAGGYFRECVFLASILLAIVSLAAVGAASEGTERFAVLALLAAIVLGVLLA